MEDRRGAPRCVDIPIQVHQCVVTMLGRETWLNATAGDFSVKGLCLFLSDSLNSGESVYVLAVVKPEGKEAKELSVNGVSTHCRPMDDGRWRVGIQFLDLTPEEQAEWAEFTQC